MLRRLLGRTQPPPSPTEHQVLKERLERVTETLSSVQIDVDLAALMEERRRRREEK